MIALFLILSFMKETTWKLKGAAIRSRSEVRVFSPQLFPPWSGETLPGTTQKPRRQVPAAKPPPTHTHILTPTILRLAISHANNT